MVIFKERKKRARLEATLVWNSADRPTKNWPNAKWKILWPAAWSPFTLDGKQLVIKSWNFDFTFSLNARLEAPPSPRKSSRRSSPKSGLLPSMLNFCTNRCCHSEFWPYVPTDSENGNVQVWSFQCHVNIGIAPLHCTFIFSRTAHFSTKKKFSGFSTGFSSWIKTSRKVNLTDDRHMQIFSSAFPPLDPLVKEKLRKVRFPYSQVAKCPELRENPFRWKNYAKSKYGIKLYRKRICRIFSTDGTGNLGLF